MLATLRVRSARNLPSLSIAISPSVMLSRPCVSDRNASLRSLVHFTGRFELARGVAGQHVLGIEEQLHAEAAADVRA